MTNTPVDINQVKQSAATGHFRSIALWLNYPLVSQGIYAQVKTDRHPGYLQVLLEFERPPKQDSLIRLVCNRICQLDSDVIRGVYLIGRVIGTEQPLWQQRVRLTQRKRLVKSPGQKEAAIAPVVPPSTSSSVKPPVAAPETAIPQTETITTTTAGSETLNAVPSYLIPREPNHQERRRRPNRNVAPFPVVKIRSADIDSSQTSAQRRHQRRRLAAPREIIDQQFKYMRAIIVTGSASAAFILGCVTETVMSRRGQVAHKETPSLPTFNNGGWRPLSEIETQEIAYRSSMRGTAVSAALESVAVMPYKSTSDPENPTVTLVFGGEVPVGDVPLQTPDAVGQVLGDLDVLQEADVAMVGLGNSLASADTSLQESYLDRSRPDAVDALRQGGIDIVGLTNDRTMDFGHQGLMETLDALDSAGIYRVGAGRDLQEARRPEVLEVKGQRIAYLSYAPNSKDVAANGKAGLNNQERDGIIEDIAALRQAVDWIVVNYRWYGDLGTEPNEQQVNLSRSAIDAGADLVVGYHPQQLQGAELYKSRPIVYALGDFIFQDAPLDDHDTATLRVSLRDKQMKVEFLPIRVREARPQTATGETAQSILKQIRQASDALPSPLQFPAILDTSAKRDSLLKPEKSAAPLKTLGELEPAPLDDSGHWHENVAPLPDGSAPDGFESNVGHEGTLELAPEMPNISPREPFETNNFDAPRFDTPDFQTDSLIDSAPPASIDNPVAPPTGYEIPASTDNPLDRFNTQPDKPDIKPFESDGTEELPTPAKLAPSIPQTAPLTNTAPAAPKALPDSPVEPLPFVDTELEADTDIDNADVESMPEQNGDSLLPGEPPLPEYDTPEGWGEKSSPHREFSPIEDRLNSLDPSHTMEEASSTVPAVSVEAEDNSHTDKDVSSGAISPHDEPLVGPLSQQPSEESKSDGVAS